MMVSNPDNLSYSSKGLPALSRQYNPMQQDVHYLPSSAHVNIHNTNVLIDPSCSHQQTQLHFSSTMNNNFSTTPMHHHHPLHSNDCRTKTSQNPGNSYVSTAMFIQQPNIQNLDYKESPNELQADTIHHH